ncbi:hypothetical protein [Paenibacillus tianmuensis]|nr:hypothetical protein [Paenibacillus tianmuensis]
MINKIFAEFGYVIYEKKDRYSANTKYIATENALPLENDRGYKNPIKPLKGVGCGRGKLAAGRVAFVYVVLRSESNSREMEEPVTYPLMKLKNYFVK